MGKFLLWCVLFVLCWPFALVAVALLPVFWLLTLPFRLLGFVLHGVFSMAWTVFVLWAAFMVISWPFRMLQNKPLLLT
jgi:hypothetical protein